MAKRKLDDVITDRIAEKQANEKIRKEKMLALEEEERDRENAAIEFVKEYMETKYDVDLGGDLKFGAYKNSVRNYGVFITLKNKGEVRLANNVVLVSERCNFAPRRSGHANAQIEWRATRPNKNSMKTENLIEAIIYALGIDWREGADGE